jgi:hypothetical protein
VTAAATDQRATTPTSVTSCADDLAKALGDVPWLTEELEVTISRQKGVDYRNVGGGKGGKKASERPSPVVWGASEARVHLRALLVSWSRFCHDEHVRNSSPSDDLPTDDLVSMSRYLLWRVDGLTLNEIGSDAVDEITSAVAHCHRLIDSRPDRWYAGPCNAETDGRECGVDLYAKSIKGDVRCEACAAVYDVAARRSWLLAAAEDRLADAATIARSVSWLGTLPLNAARVRKWAERGRIVAKAHDGEKPLYRIGDAIDLLAKEAG